MLDRIHRASASLNQRQDRCGRLRANPERAKDAVLVPLILGGVVLVLFALLSLSASEGKLGRKHAENTIFGALAVGAVVFVTIRAGVPWLGLALALLWAAAKRFAGNDRRTSAGPKASAPPKAVSEGMTRAEAYEVLGLAPGASPEQILTEYRRLMKKVHPDQGGTTYLAARLNQAKDVLLGG
jgi:DnaJ domain